MALPVLTVTQMRAWERATWATGQTEAEVIRRVGVAVGQLALRLTKPGDHLLLLAGKGHNGDDTRAAQSQLTDSRVDLLEVADPIATLPKLEAALASRPALILDGLFGIGINRALDAQWVRLIQRVNESHIPVLAVDVPSGLNAETGESMGAAIQAALTLTVGAPKSGMLRQSAWPFVGRLEVAHEVGLAANPPTGELQWTLPEDFRDFPPRRQVAGHKGSFGHVALIAGSVGFHGASVLTARGAQRAQPGLITLFTTPGAYPAAAAQLQAVMVSPWQSGTRVPDHCSGLLAGPGLASGEVPADLKATVRQLWQESPLPMVVDASALEWLEPKATLHKAVRVLTPHPGEAGRLLGVSSQEVQAERCQALRRLSERFGGAWVVLKGHQTIVGRADGPLYVNSSGNPHLAQGGSGDVLSGYLAGLLSQPELSQATLTTLRYGVWQHGATADFLQSTQQAWVVEDLVQELGSHRHVEAISLC